MGWMCTERQECSPAYRQAGTHVANSAVNNSAGSFELPETPAAPRDRGSPAPRAGTGPAWWGWGTSGLQAPSTRDTETPGTGEAMGAQMGGAQMRGASPTRPQLLSSSCPRTLLSHSPLPPFPGSLPTLPHPNPLSGSSSASPAKPRAIHGSPCPTQPFSRSTVGPHSVAFKPFQEEPPGHGGSPGSGLGQLSHTRAQALPLGITSILQWHRHRH